MSTMDYTARPNDRFASGAQAVLGMDLRSLALFRMCLAGLIIADLIARSFDLRAHYSDGGILPRAILRQWQSDFYVSLHMISGLWQVQAALFAIAGLAAGCMLVGYKTRLACVIVWFLTLSVHMRNPLVLYGADTLIRMLLFWSMFLPLGARWSVDRVASAPTHPPPKRILSPGTVALLAQVMFVYVFSALLKSGPAWTDGTAAYYALNVDHMVRGLGQWFLGHPELLNWGTHAVYYVELVGPFLLLVPFLFGPVRTAVVLIFIVLHVMFGACFQLGFFPFAGIVAMLALLPSWFWDRAFLRRVVDRTGDRIRGACAGVLGRSKQIGERSHPGPVRVRQSVVGGLACGLAMLYVLLWNIGTLPQAPIGIPQATLAPGLSLGLEQKWDMFAPEPLKDDGWFVISGQFSDGSEIDILTGAAATWDKPQLVSAGHWSDRWQKYMRNLWEREYAWTRLHFAAYLCDGWNRPAAAERRLESVELHFMLETTPPPGEQPTVERVELGEFDCRLLNESDGG